MKRTFLTTFSVALMMMSFNSFAKNCSGEIAVPAMTCINPMGGADVRLYITEFQTCKNDNIVELDRSVLGMNVVSQNSVEDIHTIEEGENLTIEYMTKRTMIDPNERVDNLSFILPTKAKIVDGDVTIEMKITDQTEPDYEGASSTHFKGSFKILKKDGTLKKQGKLICLITN